MKFNKKSLAMVLNMSLEEHDLIQTIIKGKIFLLCIFFICTILAAIVVGSQHIDLTYALENLESVEANILFTIRIPRVILCVMAGGGLAICGMVFQAIFKNPLSSPFVLGISSGASFGAVLTILLGIDSLTCTFISISSIFSFLGAIFTIYIIYFISKKNSFAIDSHLLIMAGFALNLMFLGLIILCQYLANFTQTREILHWLIGSIDILGFSDIKKILPMFIIGILIVLLNLSKLNLIAMGDDIAFTRGINVIFYYFIFISSSSLIIGAIVSVTGPICLVGLIIPHVVRLIVGANNKYIFWGSLFLGGSFLVLCDLISRIIFAPTEIPIGVISSIIGTPFFIHFLVRKQ